MKKTFAVIMLIALLCAPVFVGAGYGIFIFAADAAANISASISNSNAMFGEVSSDYYQVYFFASPYYATGAEIGENSATITDPLEIANHANNPYNVETELCYRGGQSVAEAKSNFQVDGGCYYITYKSKDENNKLSFFQQRDYTGYIRAKTTKVDGKEVTIEKTSTYVSFTVQGNIDADLLDAIVAQSEYKDPWGFGPEFVGWTADKATTNTRTVYSGGRYSMNGNTCDEDGKVIATGVPAYGNYGASGVIEQVSSTTSLQNLDQRTNTDGSSYDGSGVGDRVIYLYPVFAAKNNNKIDWQSIIKFRVNPGANPQDKQSDEVDYEKNRYTVCLFRKENKLVKDDNETPLYYTANYFTNDFYYSPERDIRLDHNDWGSDWITLITTDQIKKLELEEGYYNVSLTFYYTNASGTESTDPALESQYNYYANDPKFVKVFAPTDEAGALKTVKAWKVYNQLDAFFVIGFQKVDDFRMVYQQEDTTYQYDSNDYKQVYTATDTNQERYYYVDDVYLNDGEDFAFLTQNSTGIEVVPMTSNARYCKDCSCCSPGNTACSACASCEACVEDCLGLYQFNGQEYWLPGTIYGEGGRQSNITIPQRANKSMACHVSGYYSFVFKVTYDKGKPVQIQVAYQKKEDKYRIIVLSAKPEGDFFMGRDGDKYKGVYMPAWETDGTINFSGPFNVYKQDTVGIVAVYTGDIHSIVSADRSFDVYQWTTEGTEVETQVTSISDFFNSALMQEKKLIDSATGLEITAELFKNNSFQLNRNYVLYIQ